MVQGSNIKASAHAPVRSGTVLHPRNVTGPANCCLHLDCVLWRQSRCDRRLAGVEPAAFTSIVDGDAYVTIPQRAVWMTAPGQTGPYRWAMW